MSYWNAKYTNALGEYEITFASKSYEKTKVIEKVCQAVIDDRVQSVEDLNKSVLVQHYIKVPEKPKWISVEERLPDEWRDNSGELVNYLIYMPEYGVDVGNYALPVKTWICMGAPCKVTHWMPLPEPPKEEV